MGIRGNDPFHGFSEGKTEPFQESLPTFGLVGSYSSKVNRDYDSGSFYCGAHADAALRGIDEAIARLGPLVTLITLAIDVESDRGRYDAALVRFASLPAVLARRPNWLARRGDVLRAAGRDSEASTAYADALAAIDGLSAKRRTLKATIVLEARLRRLLARD